MGYQLITIMGGLVRDLEVRQVGQSVVAKTAVAVSEKFRKADGTVGETTEYFEVEMWDKPQIHPYLTKGTQVLIAGRQKTDRWQDQNGQTRTASRIRVDVIQLCGAKPQATAKPSAPLAQPAPSAPARPAPAPAPAPAPSPAPSAPAYQAPSDPTGDIPF